MDFRAVARATGIGSLPHKDPDQACDIILSLFKEIPFWPQLPQRSALENMNLQFAEGLPGLVCEGDEGRAFFDTSRPGFLEELEAFYQDFLDDNLDAMALRPDYAAGFETFIRRLPSLDSEPKALKGHVTGPITLGMALLDQEGRPSLHHEALADVITKAVTMRARWQLQRYESVLPAPATLVFFDEPYLTSFGSAHVSLGRAEVISRLDEVFQSVPGLTCVHCCGRTDWTLFTASTVDVISFDAYDFTESLSLYPQQLKAFLARGGWLAWGIVPSSLPSPTTIGAETRDSLVKKFEDSLGKLAGNGFTRDELLNAALITPSCGTGGMRPDLAERTLELTVSVSEHIRRKYSLED